MSDPCYAVVDGRDEPLALFGVAPDLRSREIGLVWMLGSDELSRYPLYVLRNSRAWIDRLHERYPVLWNCVDTRNTTHIRWLRWCGFKLVRLIEQYGVERRPFYEFERAAIARAVLQTRES
jgi:hypothetical protein